MWDGIYHGILRRVRARGVITTATKRTQIRIETDQVLIIRRRKSIRVWCQECACEVDMVRLEEAAALTGMAQHTLRNCIANEEWHVFQSPGESPVICLDSLLKSLGQTRSSEGYAKE